MEQENKKEIKEYPLRNLLIDIPLLYFIFIARLVFAPLILLILLILYIPYKITNNEKIESFIDKSLIFVLCPPFILSTSIAFWVLTIINIVYIF